jgi:hypothetical protein
VTMIPDRLTISLPTAATVVFDPELSARDVAHAVLVAWLAGQQGAADGITLGRNQLKLALGFSRSGSIAYEEDRAFRLSAGWVRTGDGEFHAPALPTSHLMDGRMTVHRGGMRVGGDSQQRWRVDPGLARAFGPADDGDAVELPMALLQSARSRWTVPIMLRALCWIGGWIDPRFIATRTDRRLLVRLPIEEAIDRLDLDEDVELALVMRDMLEPAAADISRCTSYGMRVRLVRSSYRARPDQPRRQGKPAAIEFDIGVPEMASITYLPTRVPGKTWERPDGPPRRRKPTPEVAGVVPFDTSLQFDLIADIGIRESEIPRVIDDDQDIEIGD